MFAITSFDQFSTSVFPRFLVQKEFSLWLAGALAAAALPDCLVSLARPSRGTSHSLSDLPLPELRMAKRCIGRPLKMQTGCSSVQDPTDRLYFAKICWRMMNTQWRYTLCSLYMFIMCFFCWKSGARDVALFVAEFKSGNLRKLNSLDMYLGDVITCIASHGLATWSISNSDSYLIRCVCVRVCAISGSTYLANSGLLKIEPSWHPIYMLVIPVFVVHPNWQRQGQRFCDEKRGCCLR